jgi:hypothetical protein
MVLTASDHKYFALGCNADRTGNYPVFKKDAEDQSSWTALALAAQQIALFNPGLTTTAAAAKDLWMVDASGAMTRYQPSSIRVSAMPSPSGRTSSLTDHYALTTKGVYFWNESAWTRVIENTTPTGTVTEIAHAGAVNVKLPNGHFQVFGPSSLWAIDDSGTIYQLGSFSAPR